MSTSSNESKVALAFSGGLDTSWCVPYLLDQGYEVDTVTVDVGGNETQQEKLEHQSKTLGASNHIHIYAKNILWQEVIRHLLAGHVLRGGTYPLCVGAERSLQARLVAEYALKNGIPAVAHGCTAAGNDQVRFEVTTRSVAPNLTMLAPVRDLTPSRPDQVQYLESKGLPVPAFGAAYSINAGLWGITIGGKETTGTSQSIPEEAWVLTKGAFDHPLPQKELVIGFEKGIPVSLDGVKMDPVDLVESLTVTAAKYGIGRGIHLGDTVLGIKGRVAFEAPASTVLIAAHRELEKITLTKRQTQVKDQAAQIYGELVHEGLFADPACRDIEALFDQSQSKVTGEVYVLLQTGNVFIQGSQSPYSLHAASRAVYGEAIGEWTAEDAKGFCRLYGLGTVLAGRAAGGNL